MNTMSMMNKGAATACTALLACSGIAGCATTSPEHHPVIQSYHPDGTGGGVTPDASALEHAEGYVLSYSAGDRIVIDVTLDSDMMQLDGPATMTIVLERPVRVAPGPGGLLVSIDGGPWKNARDAFKGNLSTNLSITATDRINRGTVALSATAR